MFAPHLRFKLWVGFGLLLVLGGLYLWLTVAQLPDVRAALRTGMSPRPSSQILARDGSILSTYGKYYYRPIPLSAVPPAFLQALLATEDRRFYQHRGVDPLSMIRALVANLGAAEVRQGASTLTQQLARTLFLSNDRSLHRKVQEAFLAHKLESELSKAQILM